MSSAAGQEIEINLADLVFELNDTTQTATVVEVPTALANAGIRVDSECREIGGKNAYEVLDAETKGERTLACETPMLWIFHVGEEELTARLTIRDERASGQLEFQSGVVLDDDSPSDETAVIAETAATVSTDNLPHEVLPSMDMAHRNRIRLGMPPRSAALEAELQREHGSRAGFHDATADNDPIAEFERF
jgi:hypothetical protein